MEAYAVHGGHDNGGNDVSPRARTRGGEGSAAMTGLTAMRPSGDTDGARHVHEAYGIAEVEDADDLLASHVQFMQRSASRNGSMSGAQQASVSRSSFRKSSSHLVDEQHAQAAIAFVAIVTFDLKQGPCLVCIDPPTEDLDGQPTLRLSAEDVESLRSDMPFKALPENGLAAAELASGKSEAAGASSALWEWAKGWGTRAGQSSDGIDGDSTSASGTHHHDHCLFMMHLSREHFFGMSHFLRVEDPSSPRGYTQGAAVCLSRLPFFSLVLQRLHSFSTDVINRDACARQVVALAADLRDTRFEELGHSAVYQDLPAATALLKLKAKLLVILRLLMLEGRVLFFARSAATVSEAVMAMASLLPGLLPLGLGRLDPPGFGLKAYRWRKYGFPLKLFRKDVPLEPLVVIGGASDVFSHEGFLAGTTNSMVQSLPTANLDLLVNVDTWEARSYRTDRARAAFDMGEQDRFFMRELVRATKRHLGGETGNDSTQAAGWQGSSAWLADQFQLYFEDLAATAAECLGRNARLEQEQRRIQEENEQKRKAFEERGRRGSALDVIAGAVSPTIEGMGLNKAWQLTASWLNGLGPVSTATALEGHGHRWAELWTSTENFATWSTSHRLIENAPDSARHSRSRSGNRSGSSSSPSSTSAKARTLRAVPAAAGVLPGTASATSALVNGLLCSNGMAAAAFLGDGGQGPGTAENPPRSGVHAYTYESGDTYTGSWRKGRRHGVGVYEERATGNSYEGDWCDDVRHGRGVLTSGAKDFMYDGDWLRDRRTGRGNCVIRGRETYSGLWKDGEFHGRGVHCDARGNVYDGEFVHGQREGAGKWTSKAGLEYVGEWKAGRMSGIGQMTGQDGTVYSGDWHDGRYAGEGTLTLPSGERYEGNFRDGEKHGPGALLTSEGDTLEGEWVKAKPKEEDTEWRIRFGNGDHYAGTLMNGVPHGSGTYKYSNGDVFTGGWDCGLRHGQGICVFGNGERFEGEWVRDHISYRGKGALTLADGTTHEFA